MKVHSLPRHDELHAPDGRAVMMRDQDVVLVSALGALIVELLDGDPVDVADLGQVVLDSVGAPPDGVDIQQTVAAAVDLLVQAGLVQIVSGA